MRSKVKWCLLSGLVALVVVPLLGCGFLEELVNPPTLNRQQAVALVIVAGVPYIDDYFKETVGGTWDASYQGKGEWEIQGPVTTNSWGECLTTWTLSEADSKIRLIEFNCD